MTFGAAGAAWSAATTRTFAGSSPAARAAAGRSRSSFPKPRSSAKASRGFPRTPASRSKPTAPACARAAIRAMSDLRGAGDHVANVRVRPGKGRHGDPPAVRVEPAGRARIASTGDCCRPRSPRRGRRRRTRASRHARPRSVDGGDGRPRRRRDGLRAALTLISPFSVLATLTSPGAPDRRAGPGLDRPAAPSVPGPG